METNKTMELELKKDAFSLIIDACRNTEHTTDLVDLACGSSIRLSDNFLMSMSGDDIRQIFIDSPPFPKYHILEKYFTITENEEVICNYSIFKIVKANTTYSVELKPEKTDDWNVVKNLIINKLNNIRINSEQEELKNLNIFFN